PSNCSGQPKVATVMGTLLRSSCAVTCALLSLSTFAADFDGKAPLICATIDAHSCDPGETCERGLAADLGLPQFMKIDFAKKTIEGTERSTPILSINKSSTQIL